MASGGAKALRGTLLLGQCEASQMSRFWRRRSPLADLAFTMVIGVTSGYYIFSPFFRDMAARQAGARGVAAAPDRQDTKEEGPARE